MIILDTNVLSALMQEEPPDPVIRWLDAQPKTAICTTAVCIFEIEFGLRRLPHGKKRQLLQEAFAEMTKDVFTGWVLPFDAASASEAAELAALGEAQGHNIDSNDHQIAGIVRSCNATLATRNTKHFVDLCATVNPWKGKE